MASNSLGALLLRLTASHEEQRFYQLRFMWTAIAAFERLGLPDDQLDELRGLYRGFADGVLFSQHITDQQKGTDPKDQSQS